MLELMSDRELAEDSYKKVEGVLKEAVRRIREGKDNTLSYYDDEHLIVRDAIKKMKALENTLNLQAELARMDYIKTINPKPDQRRFVAVLYQKSYPTSEIENKVEEHNCEIVNVVDQEITITCPRTMEVDVEFP